MLTQLCTAFGDITHVQIEDGFVTTTLVIKGGGLKMWVSGIVSGENNFYRVPKEVTLMSTQIQISISNCAYRLRVLYSCQGQLAYHWTRLTESSPMSTHVRCVAWTISPPLDSAH